jgi:hypothetical protein
MFASFYVPWRRHGFSVFIVTEDGTKIKPRAAIFVLFTRL